LVWFFGAGKSRGMANKATEAKTQQKANTNNLVFPAGERGGRKIFITTSLPQIAVLTTSKSR
jgi:hypothetical protein